GLELLAAPHEGISLGDLVWDSALGSPAFAHSGMPNTIYTAFLDAGLIDEIEFDTFKTELLETKLLQAHFPERTVDVKTELLAELEHPTLGKIEGEFKLESISKFTFGELQMKEMDDMMRVKIDQYLELMKKKKWEEYDGRIRRVYMITELYYGSIKLVVEKSLSGQFDAALEKSGLSVVSKSDGSRSAEYEFAHEKVPFAMRIEEVRTFNG
ncbi:hypothetical protein ACFLQX_03215, partial [Bacteroidota bacterium]